MTRASGPTVSLRDSPTNLAASAFYEIQSSPGAVSPQDDLVYAAASFSPDPNNSRVRAQALAALFGKDLQVLSDPPLTGGFFHVYHARDEVCGDDFAIKVPANSLDSRAPLRVDREVQLSKGMSVDHPAGFVRSDKLEDPSTGSFGIKAPWVPQEISPEYLNGLTFEQRIELSLKIAQSVALLHGDAVFGEKKIIHGDLKLSQVRCDVDGIPKLVDLSGVPMGDAELKHISTKSITFSSEVAALSHGMWSSRFAAPEQTENPPRLLEQTDVYHLGRMLSTIIRAAVEQPSGLHIEGRGQEFNALINETQRSKPEDRPKSVKDLIARITEITDKNLAGEDAAVAEENSPGLARRILGGVGTVGKELGMFLAGITFCGPTYYRVCVLNELKKISDEIDKNGRPNSATYAVWKASQSILQPVASAALTIGCAIAAGSENSRYNVPAWIMLTSNAITAGYDWYKIRKSMNEAKQITEALPASQVLGNYGAPSHVPQNSEVEARETKFPQPVSCRDPEVLIF